MSLKRKVADTVNSFLVSTLRTLLLVRCSQAAMQHELRDAGVVAVGDSEGKGSGGCSGVVLANVS